MVSLPDEQKVIEEFKGTLKEANATAKKYRITMKDIEAEIRAMREGK